MKTITWIVIILVILIGGYLVLQKGSGENMEVDIGSYAYRCEGGVEFTMTPSSDVSSITLTPGIGATFEETILMATDSTAGARFEGGGMVFIGAGEEVQLTQDGRTMVCNPVPSTDMAPWNWGDAGEGAGSMQPDVRLVVGESIMGKWESSDDAKFVREFKGFTEGAMSGTVVDWYDGKEQSKGSYVVFSSEDPLEVAFPIQKDRAYLQLTMQGTQADTLNFSVDKLTPEELQLTYMDRGGVLRFTSVE